MKNIVTRLKEGSTWAALAVLLGVFGVPGPIVQLIHIVLNVAPDLIQALAVLGAAGAGVALPDRGRAE